MAKEKLMQIDVYKDGTIQVLDAVQTEAAGKPVEAEETSWKKFHGYLKTNEEKDAVAEAQLSVIVTNPCTWVLINGTWYYVCS